MKQAKVLPDAERKRPPAVKTNDRHDEGNYVAEIKGQEMRGQCTGKTGEE